jgi:diaminohydroxyphosphoribosylaminopyrimidine deaminase/5-amino-6-(5-phosphoribosylamino)uracil reductase
LSVVCRLSSVVCCLFLWGCALSTPPPHAEVVQQALPTGTTIPPAWSAAANPSDVSGDWLKSFADPGLDTVVAEAIANNLDLRQAAARVEVARQTVVVVGAQLLPQVGARMGGATTHLEGQDGSFQSNAEYLGVAWEIDLWGRLRAQRAAAQAGFEATALDYAFARQSLAATTAQSWYLAIETRQRQLRRRACRPADRRRHGELERGRILAAVGPAVVFFPESCLKRPEEHCVTTHDDARFMRMALRRGRRGLGRTSPNPPVGAVVVARGAVVGRGFHRQAGAPHAEVAALQAAGPRARGATLYVTLEPCAHHGRTPPCTDAVIAAGVRRVVVGTRDPNPRVPGNGLQRLRAAGIAVHSGVLQAECDALIAAFRKHVTTGRPLVTLKLAASLDGRIATATGDSRWITGEDSRRFVHRLRAEHDAILVGAETIIRDDPALTCRVRGGRNPLRVVLDGRLRLPLRAQVLTQPAPAATVVITAQPASSPKVRQLRARGVEVVSVAARTGRIPITRVMRELGQRNIMSVLIEGGATVAAAALAAGAVDRLLVFVAPKLIGGDGWPMLAGLGVRGMRDALALGPLRVRRFAQDLLVATQVGP